MRVMNEFADGIFSPDEGTHLGRISLVRKIVIPSDDPRLPYIILRQRELRDAGLGMLVGSSGYVRKYSPEDLASAELFELRISATVYPDGAYCGTVYDPASACPVCGAGRTTDRLRLKLAKVPAHADIAKSIGQDEWIVSQRFVDLVRSEGFTGLEFVPVENAVKRRPRKPVRSWFQLRFTGPRLSFTPRSRFGQSPVDPENRYACPAGDTAGHRLLSLAHVARPSGKTADFMRSVQHVGSSVLVARPVPLMFVSPAVYRALKREDIKGAKFDVAYFDRER